MKLVQVLKNIPEDLFSLAHSIRRRISPILNIKDKHFTYTYYFLPEWILKRTPVFLDCGLNPRLFPWAMADQLSSRDTGGHTLPVFNSRV
jgi:hypothetical protein